MVLSVSTNREAIAAELDRVVAVDPVRHTLLGTARGRLEDTAWLCWHADGLAVRTAAEFPLVVSGDWPEALRGELVSRLRDLPGVHKISGPAGIVEDIAFELAGHRALRRVALRLFRLDELNPPSDVQGRAVVAGPADRDLVREWYVAFLAETEPEREQSKDTMTRAADQAMSHGTWWLWLAPDGTPVSMARRRTVVAGSSRIGPVYTPTSARVTATGRR